eukprot:INCI3252.2.p1 GENE.INCI3252.2~~INCI3252.2.p1  ORF type:complete len:525 (-),score=81.36 INCI3252.2:1062-2636(-)
MQTAHAVSPAAVATADSESLNSQTDYDDFDEHEYDGRDYRSHDVFASTVNDRGNAMGLAVTTRVQATHSTAVSAQPVAAYKRSTATATTASTFLPKVYSAPQLQTALATRSVSDLGFRIIQDFKLESVLPQPPQPQRGDGHQEQTSWETVANQIAASCTPANGAGASPLAVCTTAESKHSSQPETPNFQWHTGFESDDLASEPSTDDILSLVAKANSTDPKPGSQRESFGTASGGVEVSPTKGSGRSTQVSSPAVATSLSQLVHKPPAQRRTRTPSLAFGQFVDIDSSSVSDERGSDRPTTDEKRGGRNGSDSGQFRAEGGTSATAREPECTCDPKLQVLEIKVPDAVVAVEKPSGFAVYFRLDTLRLPKSQGACKLRRYSELYTLKQVVDSIVHNAVDSAADGGAASRARDAVRALRAAPPFPTKRWRLVTNHSCPRFVESRRRNIEAYLQAVVKVPLIAAHPKFLRFVGLPCPRHYSPEALQAKRAAAQARVARETAAASGSRRAAAVAAAAAVAEPHRGRS